MFNPSLYRGDFDVRSGTLFGGSGAIQVFPANPTAVYRSVASFGTAELLMSLTEPPGPTDFTIIVPGMTTWEWFWERHGLLVTVPWWYYAGVLSGPLAWCEMTFQPHVHSTAT